MTHMADCPSLDELADFTHTGDAAVGEHVSRCRRCRALLRLVEQRESVAPGEFASRELQEASLPHREPPGDDLTFGEICVVDTDFSDGTLLVAVVLDHSEEEPETVEVAPISTAITNASEWDLLLAAEDGPLGYPAMVELWNHGTVLPDQVVERFGLLAVDGQHRLNAMYEALLNDEAPPVDVPRGVPVIADGDPRALFQEDEAERVQLFWQPAARIFSETAPDAAASVGALLNHWLEQAGYDASDLAHKVGWPTEDVLLVRSDRVDPQRFPSDRLAELFRPTDISLEEIKGGLWQTVRPLHFAFGTTVIEEQVAFRRTARRRGADRAAWVARGAAAEQLPPEERERRRKQYINEVLDAVEEKRGF
jgi:hypothetical protein